MRDKTFAEAGSSQDAHRQFAGQLQSQWRVIDLGRHGATHLNNNDTSVDRIRGWKDIPLSEQGVQEAHKLGAQLKSRPPDFIMSSDMRRASETAKIVSDYTGAPVVLVSKAFRPWNAGELAGKQSKIAVPIMADYADNKPDEPLPGGESYHQFLARFFCGMHSALVAHPRGLPLIMAHHRNERSLHAWKALGFPVSGEIDKKVFGEKGEGTAGVMRFEIPLDRLRAAADCHRQRMSGAHEGQPSGPKRQTLCVPEGHSILGRARQAPDGNHYIEDPQAKGKYLRVDE